MLFYCCGVCLLRVAGVVLLRCVVVFVVVCCVDVVWLALFCFGLICVVLY